MDNTSIDFTSFTQAILKDLQEKFGADYAVFSQSVTKNNGVELTGIAARQAGHSASPTIYIDRFYKKDITRQEITQISAVIYDEFKAAELQNDPDLSDFISFDKAKKKLAFKLIHEEKNREQLKTLPHRRFHNLAIVLYYSVSEAPFYGKATILVNHSHMRQWGTNIQELMEIAAQNTPVLFPGVISNMTDILKEILAESLKKDIAGVRVGEKEAGDLLDETWFRQMVEQMSENAGKEKVPMYVLTNQQKFYGAACMLYPGMLKAFAEKMEQDFYILPSSVHEVILVPAGSQNNQEALCEIVTEINRTQVAEDEVLADSVYYYDRERDKIFWIS